MSAATYTKSGTKASTIVQLDKAVFDVEIKNHQLLKDVYLSYLAQGRQNNAATKTRGEVRGGGKKPWKQKGTGRARFGSSRVPLWRGGGITFGPTGNENYSKKINKQAKSSALRQALSLARIANKISIIEAFDAREGKVKPAVSLINKLGAKGNILVVVAVKDELVDRSTRNLPHVKAVQSLYLNVYDVLNADSIFIDKKSLELISDWLGGHAKTSRAKTEAKQQ